MQTKFNGSSQRSRATKGQVVLYGAMILLSAAAPVPYAYGWWTARHQALAAETTPAPSNQVQQPTTTTPQPAPATQFVQVQPTPTEDQRREWKHIPPSQIDPGPMPTIAQPAAFQPATPTPDRVEVRHAQWQALHDAYVMQVRARVQAAKTDAEKGQIQREITVWQRANPEPPKPTATPTLNANGEEQVRIR